MLMAKIFFAFPHRFDDEFPNYRVALKEACRDQNHEAVFASTVPAGGFVLEHVSDCIEGCSAAFFDITGLNPSVLIEFGLAYAKGAETFILLNERDHVTVTTKFLGGRTQIPLGIPADMSGKIRTHYTSTFDLRQSLNRTLEQYFPSKPEVLPLAQKILQHVKKFGPLPIGKIVNAVAEPYEVVRPVVSAMIATQQLDKAGLGPGTQYSLPSKPPIGSDEPRMQ